MFQLNIFELKEILMSIKTNIYNILISILKINTFIFRNYLKKSARDKKR